MLKVLYSLLFILTPLLTSNLQAQEADLGMMQIVCAPSELVKKQLEGIHKETKIFVGVVNDGSQVVEIYISNSMPNTFSILLSSPQGTSCVAISGNNLTLSDSAPKIEKQSATH